jgi:CYTH domain-containing protein
MSIEIERGFLVASLPLDRANQPRHLQHECIANADNGVEARVRAADGDFALTVSDRRIEKYRTRYPLGKLIAENDSFEGAPPALHLVDVELPTVEAAESFRPAAWFGAEDTAGSSYRNKALALVGLK